jgi:hypothetical protein
MTNCERISQDHGSVDGKTWGMAGSTLNATSLWEHESKLPTNLLEERVTMFKSRAKKFCLRGNLKTIF